MVNHDYQTVKAITHQGACDEVADDLQEWEGTGVCVDENRARGRWVGVNLHLLISHVTCNIILYEN